MKLLLVDDEPPALSKLRRFLTEMPDVDIVGEAGDGVSALALLATLSTDAVLLDIQMPGMSGLEVAASLPPHVLAVFVTAYDAHAVRAFDLNAVDYLLKPYTRERLTTSIARLATRLAAPVADRGLASPPPRRSLQTALHGLQPVPGHWLVATRLGLVHVPLASIECVTAADNYVELHTGDRSHIDRITLAGFLEHPSTAAFLQVHRSVALNLAHVCGIAALPKGDAQITLTSGRQVRLSRRFRGEVLQRLEAGPATP